MYAARSSAAMRNVVVSTSLNITAVVDHPPVPMPLSHPKTNTITEANAILAFGASGNSMRTTSDTSTTDFSE